MGKAKHKTQQQTNEHPNNLNILSILHGLASEVLPRRAILRKITLIIFATLVLWVGSMYGIAQWYFWSNRNRPTVIGATFISNYAEYLGVDPKETLGAIIYDLRVGHLRLVSYWDEIERTKGTYDFSNLDWQMDMAQQANIPVSLAVGLRQPRWPECHMPTWALGLEKEVWYPQLTSFMTAVVERYKNRPNLESYQLENEFFLSVFGECQDFDRERLIDEAKLIKQLDSTHPLIISRSNNAVGIPVGQPRPDLFGISVYKRVWDKTITKRYYEYPFPAWFYGFLAGAGKIVTGKDMTIHELQTEAWLAEGFEIKTAPIDELYKSLNPERLKDRIEYGSATGMKTIDLWGVEWWYQMKVRRGHPELWDTAKKELEKY